MQEKDKYEKMKENLKNVSAKKYIFKIEVWIQGLKKIKSVIHNLHN